MVSFFHQLIEQSAKNKPHHIALQYKSDSLTYQTLNSHINCVAQGLLAIGLTRHNRVGVYLNKTVEAVSSIFATSLAGGIFVPINPVLKAQQVKHIIQDANMTILVTNKSRLNTLTQILPDLPSLTHIVVVDGDSKSHSTLPNYVSWQDLIKDLPQCSYSYPENSNEAAGILYTSGSTGKPKGIVLSHKNLVLGAISVSNYLENTESDAILALLPLSFDYGLSQLTTAFYVGARCVLFDYLLPKDVLTAISRYQITGLAAVPPLWAKLAQLTWPEKEISSMRYITNSGGALPTSILAKLQQHLPLVKPYLMYGLTEAFRSTYLSPEQIKNRPSSIGKAIPNAEILVVRDDGSECDAHENGELVHCGPLVSLGYWNSPKLTAERFKSAPNKLVHQFKDDKAVWSGDIVYKDSEGYLYFVNRADDMIKSSGYRISPTEIEEVLTQHEDIIHAAVFGVKKSAIGQTITAIISCSAHCEQHLIKQELIKQCLRILPNYMQPNEIIIENDMPINVNGKIDRVLLRKKHLREAQ